jgi:hypothetical protein
MAGDCSAATRRAVQCALQNTLRTALLGEGGSAGSDAAARADALRAIGADAALMDRIERLLLDADEKASDDLRSGRMH